MTALSALVLAQDPVQIQTGLAWPAVATGIFAIVGIIGAIAGLVGWAARRGRRKLERMVEQVVEQVTPTNGTRLAEYIEQNAEAIKSLREAGQTTRDIAAEARGSARHAHERIDTYLVGQSVIAGMDGG